ncbi:hypothetical protein PENTCL1PPCAC_186, partial [Pristionchus entomophagus]
DPAHSILLLTLFTFQKRLLCPITCAADLRSIARDEGDCALYFDINGSVKIGAIVKRNEWGTIGSSNDAGAKIVSAFVKNRCTIALSPPPVSFTGTTVAIYFDVNQFGKFWNCACA